MSGGLVNSVLPDAAWRCAGTDAASPVTDPNRPRPRCSIRATRRHDSAEPRGWCCSRRAPASRGSTLSFAPSVVSSSPKRSARLLSSRASCSRSRSSFSCSYAGRGVLFLLFLGRAFHPLGLILGRRRCRCEEIDEACLDRQDPSRGVNAASGAQEAHFPEGTLSDSWRVPCGAACYARKAPRAAHSVSAIR
jgi:hypothetical protein